jgi:hypothetical protein
MDVIKMLIKRLKIYDLLARNKSLLAFWCRVFPSSVFFYAYAAR